MFVSEVLYGFNFFLKLAFHSQFAANPCHNCENYFWGKFNKRA